MKKLFLILMMIFLIFGWNGCAFSSLIKQHVDKPTYTYDGDIDPKIFNKWTPERYAVDKDGYYHVVMINPDKDDKNGKDSEIRRAIVVIHRNVLVVYSFIRDGVQYLYALDSHNGHYEQVEPKTLW